MSVAMIEPLSSSGMSPRRLLGAYLTEARTECLRYFRAPSFLLPVTLFATMFYLLFGIVMNHNADADTARYLLASYGVFGVMSPGLFGFGVSLAMERDNGLLTLKRALPMPPGAYLLGKMVMAMFAAGVVVLLLLALAVGLGHVPLGLAQALSLLVTGMLGVLPFCAMGMLVGTLVKGQGAPGVINIIYLPMSFLSGLWIPLHLLPLALQRIAPVWPSAHLQQLALGAVGLGHTSPWPHVAVLLAYTTVFFLLAARRLRRLG
ncbi:ABC transporter permease [Dyella japonica]|uniref:Transport permease protein n=1 Tax=Dyella japonica A8 TaxID=1217721 RepID=A0A075JZK3_9GAMM|nr:ABC transporter permease [Dyella japonica]AIF47344.1 ABC transporter permease [Dyella japonica A8]